MTTKLADAERLRRLRKLVRRIRRHDASRVCTNRFDVGFVYGERDVLDRMVREGIIPKPRKRKAKR